MDNFSFTIKVTCCAECPLVEFFPYGMDCKRNMAEWPFRNMNDGISLDCPFRKEVSNGSNGNRSS